LAVTEPPLRQAALDALNRPPCANGWQHLAHLYAGAVLQLRSASPLAPSTGAPLPSLAELEQLDLRATSPVAKAPIVIAANAILEETDPQRLSALARPLIRCLGPAVYARLCSVLAGDPLSADGEGAAWLQRGTLGGTSYQLLPSHFGGGAGATSVDPINDRFTALLPADGWSRRHTRVLPRHVRVLTGERYRVLYLDLIDPDANARLLDSSAGHELRLAALPLHRELRMASEPLGRQDGARVFRLKEPDSWPRGWADHLRHWLQACDHHRASVALLPELLGSPRVVAICREHLRRHRHPVLLAAGSWHTDAEAGGFVNRLQLLTRGTTGREMYHDKFAQFATEDLIEGNKPGAGLTFLITSVGIIALGICRDWFPFAQPDSGAGMLQVLAEAVPTLALMPAMTAEARELVASVSSLFRRERTVVVFANACGQLRLHAQQHCCQGDGANDLRSFVAVPKTFYDLTPLIGAGTDAGVARFARAPCAGQKAPTLNENAVIACARLQAAPHVV